MTDAGSFIGFWTRKKIIKKGGLTGQVNVLYWFHENWAHDTEHPLIIKNY